jgi:hypothetical protein
MGVSKASLRGLPIDQRIRKMQEAAAKDAKTVRVSPANDDMRRVLAHPRAGYFPAEGSAEWPDDDFTHRRIRDGDITAETAEKPVTAENQSSKGQSSGGEPSEPVTEQ